MKRRDFLVGGAVVGAAATTLAAPALAEGKQTWKLVMPWPKNAPGVGMNAERFARMVTTMSDGRLTVKTFAGGELVPPFEVLDAVQNDVAQMGHGTAYYNAGKAQALNFFTTIPFGLTAPELQGWLRFGDGQALWEEVYGQLGVVPFYAGNSGVQGGGWFARELTGLDDLKGLKMRIAGLGGEVMRRLGVAVVMTPPGEITTSLLSGAVDAAEWVGPWNDIAFGLYKAAKYYYTPAFHEPGPALEVIVNKDRFAELPADLKEIVRRAAQASSAEALADFTFHNIQTFGDLDKYGVELRTWPDDVVKAMGKATIEVLEEVADSDPQSRKVYDSYRTFLKKAVGYEHWFDKRLLEMREEALGL